MSFVMQAVTLISLCLPPKNCRDLFLFCPVLLFFCFCPFSCFLPLKFFPRFLPPSPFFLLFDFFLQEFLPFLHFLRFPFCSPFPFLLFPFCSPFPFCSCFFRLGTAFLWTIWCMSLSTLTSIFDETIASLSTLWKLADTDMRRGRSPKRRRGKKKDGVKWCFMFPGKREHIICNTQNKNTIEKLRGVNIQLFWAPLFQPILGSVDRPQT